MRTDVELKHQTSLILGANWTPKDRPGTTIEAQLKLPVSGTKEGATELVIGMYNEPKVGWRAYNEVELTYEDRLLLTRSRLGFEYRLNDWLHGSTELSNSPGDNDSTYHQGIGIDWQMNDLTSFRVDVEHSRKIESGDDALTSIAFGAKWESYDGAYIGDADFDTTFEERGKTYYASLGLAAQLTPDLAVLARSCVALDERDDADFKRIRTRIGAAYRPLSDPRLEVLAWYEHRLEERHGRSETHLWSVDATYEVNEDLRLNGKYAGQRQQIETADGSRAGATTQLLQGGLNFEFADDRFQIGVNAAHLWDSEGNSSHGLGAELGFSPAKGTLIALGYNATKGEVSGQSALYQKGVYLRLNFLLDNSLWDQLDGFLGN